jgi:hypothetical protein
LITAFTSLHSRKVLQKQDFHFKQQTKKTQESARRTENTISFASVISQAQNLRVSTMIMSTKFELQNNSLTKQKTVETIN